MSGDKTFESEWDHYSKMIFRGINPGEVQRKETKQAFFAGAYAMLSLLCELGDDELGDEVVKNNIDKLTTEVTDFHKAIIKEYVDRN